MLQEPKAWDMEDLKKFLKSSSQHLTYHPPFPQAHTDTDSNSPQPTN